MNSMVFCRESHCPVTCVLIDALALLLDYEDVVGACVGISPNFFAATEVFAHFPSTNIHVRTPGIIQDIITRLRSWPL
jgi:hypothetical protein